MMTTLREAVVRYDAAVHAELAATNIPLDLLARLERRGDRTLTVFYSRLLRLVAREPYAGVRDLLLHRARKVFRCTLKSLRKDLAAIAEIDALDAMLGGEDRR